MLLIRMIILQAEHLGFSEIIWSDIIPDCYFQSNSQNNNYKIQ
jgi:hypothetical protein